MAHTERRVTRKFEVTTTTCNSQRKTRSTVVSTETRDEAIERAIEKMYGPRCFWVEDSGLPGYGQVFESLPPSRNNSNPGNSSVTDRVSLDIRPLAKKSRAFLKQEAYDRKIYAEIREWEDNQRAAHDLGENAAYNGQPRPTSTDYTLDVEMERGYQVGLDQINDDQQRRQQEADEERWADEEYQREREVSERNRIEARNGRRERNYKRLSAEVERIRAIDLTQPITDKIMSAVIKSIALVSFQHTMPLGQWKSEMLDGKHNDIVRGYLDGDWLFTRLENVVPREWEIGDDE